MLYRCSVIMPWERIVRLCKERDVLSLVDAAHHLGQLPVDLKSVQPDFWVSVSRFRLIGWFQADSSNLACLLVIVELP